MGASEVFWRGATLEDDGVSSCVEDMIRACSRFTRTPSSSRYAAGFSPAPG